MAMMSCKVGNLTEREQVELGLARVAGTNLVFRHNALSAPYAELNPRSMGVDFYGTKEIHRWVVRARGIESDDAA